MKIRIAINKLSYWLCGVSCITIAIMMVLMVVDALSRKFIGSIPGGYYTTIALLTILLYFPQGFAQMHRAHITVDLVTSRLSNRKKNYLSIITTLLGIFVFSVLTWAGGVKAWEATLAKEMWMGAIFYPAWPFRWCIPIGLGVFTMQLIITAIDDFRAIIRGAH
jgi:TRAP-type mannitol/chloroaromatic compound transport system permease small subunit